MTTPTRSEVHIDRYLTDYSLAWRQEQKHFVTSAAVTDIPVKHQSDKYLEYDRGYFWRDDLQARPLGERPRQTSYATKTASYMCTEYANEHRLDDRIRDNADDVLSLGEVASELLTGKHMIKQDRLWVAEFFKTGVWTLTMTGTVATVSATQFIQFNEAASMPIRTMALQRKLFIARTGMIPNVLVIGADVMVELVNHAELQETVKYTQGGLIDNALIAALFKVDRVVEPLAIYNTANEGASESLSFIANPKAMALLHIAPRPALNTPTAIAMFSWTGLIPGTGPSRTVISAGRESAAYSDYWHGRAAFDMKVVSADLGVFFDQTVA